MKLSTDLGNFQGCKIIIASEICSNVKVQVDIVSSDVKVDPNQSINRLPVLEAAPGQYLTSPNAAASYIWSQGKKDVKAISISELLEWEASYLQPFVHNLLASAVGKKLENETFDEVKKLLKQLPEKLEAVKAATKETVTLADVVVFPTVYPFLSKTSEIKGISVRDDIPEICEWFDALVQQTPFQQAVTKISNGKLAEVVKVSLSAQASPFSVNASTKKFLEKGGGGSSSNDSSSDSEETSLKVNAEERDAALKGWNLTTDQHPKPRKLQHPVLPIKGEKNILITSALPYVNNIPHLGNIIGCVLSADVFARFCRLRNYNTLYVCGTDEYGTATETKALEEGLTPQQICDKYNKLHTEVYQWFNIGFDYFGRTTTQHQTKIAQDIFWDLHKNGFVLQDSVEQLLCEKCNRYLADRFVEGVCPFCSFEDARGDQCDKCGKLINAVELKSPRCKVCGTSPVVKTSEHLFLDLPKLEGDLVQYLDKSFETGHWTSNTKLITKSWIRDGLKPRCISRDLKWGTPVPLEGFTDKVFYVWFDAPIGYLSITANYTEKWEQWWKNPQEVSLYNFMAKDNVPFHSVIFPCSLLGTKKPWTIVSNLSATEYLNYEDGKFSKSRGIGVFGNNAKDSGIPADIWRFYLLFLRPESQDSSFNWDDFVIKNNSELLNNLGNYINRALMFIFNSFNGEIPTMTLTEEDLDLISLINRELKQFVENLDNLKLRDGIKNILNISRHGNGYIQANQPWVLVKGNPQEKARAGTILGLAANVSCLLSVLLHPYMPDVSATIQSQCNAPSTCNVIQDHMICLLPAGHKIGKPSPLFQRIEGATVEELRKKYAGKQADSAVVVSPQMIAKLNEEITKQGNVVRELKAKKAEKSQIEAGVKTLLELKQKLTATQGGPEAGQKKGGDNKKGGGKKGGGGGNVEKSASAPTQAPPATGPVNAAEVDRLTAEVTAQGDKVRTLKTTKADKGEIDAAVQQLLALKTSLALAMGQDPNQATGGSGKKGKKGKKK